ncbi:LuxR C-terminal-related transcriptional regulator [Pseudonocardia sediminis]|uniref:LuxR C-terminal-related transcriptional regulator n=1 Tax=Pseudonocardia sediminis TaxID=1397368 RepID=UPI0010290351|nr:LuxR C-terminal-related transcriptional regulator [Pseudonocardia sediminis]
MSRLHRDRAYDGRARRPGRGNGTGCVLILDVHPMFRRMLGPALHEEGMDVHEVGFDDEQVMLTAVAGLGTGVVLFELAPASEKVGGRIRTGPFVAALTANGNPVLAVSGHGDESSAAGAVAAGAVGVLSKDLPLPDLVNAVVRAGAGLPVMSAPEHGLWLSRHHERSVRRSRVADRLARLRPREQEILRLLAAGRRSSEIAGLFGTPPATLRAEVRSMMTVLGAGSQIEAVAMLFESRADAW